MRQLVYTSLFLRIALCFACSESKICSTIKNSQNIMNMNVGLLQKFEMGKRWIWYHIDYQSSITTEPTKQVR